MPYRRKTSGSSDEMKGRLRSAYGEVAGDEEQRRKGKVEKTEGRVKEYVERASDRVKRAIERKRS